MNIQGLIIKVLILSLSFSQLKQVWGLPYSYMNCQDNLCMLNLAEA